MNNLGYFIGLIAAVELAMAAILFRMYKESRNKLTLCFLLICVGLFIDAFFIAIGGLFEGGLPEGVSRLRFVAHGGLIPLLFPVCGYGLKLKQKAINVIWAFTTIVIILGLSHAFALNLELKSVGDTLRHTAAATSPLWAKRISSVLSYGTVIPLIVSGLVAWIRQKNPHLFLSGFLMFAFAALGPATGNFNLIFFISMFGELCMILFGILYIKKDAQVKEKEEKKAA